MVAQTNYSPINNHETRIAILEREQDHLKEWETKQNGSLQRMADDLADLRKDMSKENKDLREHVEKQLRDFSDDFKKEMRDYRNAVTKAQWSLITALVLISLDLVRGFF